MKTDQGTTRSRTIKVDYLARVEGEGALIAKVKNGHVADVKLKIFEPPRFFESLLLGRSFTEAPDITARICGICPIAYQMSSSQAMEAACGVEVTGALRDLRHLIYCGEWIESHALHVFMLHAPDFLGYQDAIQMAKDHAELVQRGLRIKKIGNRLMAVLGGREIHPVNPRVGGFHRLPTRHELEAFVDDVSWALEAASETLEFASTIDFPKFERDYEYVALQHPDEYAILSGRLVSNRGLDIPIESFLDEFEEFHVEHSTSLHARHRERGAYLVGPMARFNLNFGQLSPRAQDLASSIGLEPPCMNPFRSLLVRLVEIIHACEVALEIIERYQDPAESYIETVPKGDTGVGCTEAPRGICWHRYTIDEAGIITDATIVPPTSQNQGSMEEDMRRFIEENLDLDDDDLQWKCEQGIRNYDPCISCSCHFLDLKLDRQ